MAFHRIGLSPVKRRNRVLAAPGPPSTTVRGLTIMATESVVETPAREAFDCASVASVGMKDDFYLEFGVPSRCCRADTMAEYAEQMAGCARAALKCARSRGDNAIALPQVFDEALGT